MSGDAERLIEWINDPNRKPPALAFTAGSLRTAADAIEESGVLERCTWLEAEVERLKGIVGLASRQRHAQRVYQECQPGTHTAYIALTALEQIETAIDEALPPLEPKRTGDSHGQ